MHLPYLKETTNELLAKEEKIQFAKKYQNWTLNKWHSVLWSDENTICEWWDI